MKKQYRASHWVLQLVNQILISRNISGYAISRYNYIGRSFVEFEPLYALGGGQLQCNSRSVQQLLTKKQNKHNPFPDIEGNKPDEDQKS